MAKPSCSEFAPRAPRAQGPRAARGWLRIPCRAGLVALLGAAPALAHGGMYRGPTPVPAITTPGAVPTNPGGGPTTPSGGQQPATSLTSWAFWWEYNKDRFLRLRESVQGAAPASAGDSTTAVPDAGRAPTAAQIEQRVMPALKRLLDSTDNRDVATACTMALAKIGRTHPEFDVLEVFREHLDRGNQEIRETGALAFGVARLPGAFEALAALATDSRAGRRDVGRSSVRPRTRAFAVYGLGLLAARAEQPELRARVLDELIPLLADEKLDDRDLQVALVHAIGLAADRPASARGRRSAWRAMRALEQFWDRDVGRGEELMQAHVPTVLARLLGRGDGPDQRRLRDEWIEELGPRSRRHDTVQQSLILALGEIALPPEAGADHAAASAALERYYARGKNQQARHFCLVALGRIGGEQNLDRLIRLYRRANTGTEKPWAALGLGLLAWQQRTDGGPIAPLLGELLHRGLRDIESPEHRGAAAVALGLAGYQRAADDMTRLLRKLRRRDEVAGYLALGLALMRAPGGKAEVRTTLRESVRRPRLLAQTAIALALYEDFDAPRELLRLMHDGSSNLARLAAIATAFRYVGDRAAVDPLLEAMFAPDTTTLTRAFMAAALGGVCAQDPLPWNEPVARHTNYLANVPTLRNGLTGILDIL